MANGIRGWLAVVVAAIATHSTRGPPITFVDRGGRRITPTPRAPAALFPTTRGTNMNRQSDKGTAVITGASTGIGALYAERLARRGYDLILVARNLERLAALAARLESSTPAKVETISADLSDAGGLRRLEEILRTSPNIS